MDIERTIQVIDREWNEGVLWDIRHTKFTLGSGQSLLEALRSIQLGDAPTVRRDLVRLIWFMPLFISWNQHRVKPTPDAAISDFRDFCQFVLDEVERILGQP